MNQQALYEFLLTCHIEDLRDVARQLEPQGLAVGEFRAKEPLATALAVFALKSREVTQAFVDVLKRDYLRELIAQTGRYKNFHHLRRDDLEQVIVAMVHGEAAPEAVPDAMEEASEPDTWAARDVEDEDTEGDYAQAAPAWTSQNEYRVGAANSLPAGLAVSPATGLQPHQTTALSRLQDWFESTSPRGILCLPTGGGKTRVAVEFALRQLAKGKRVLWLAHRNELVDQACEAFLRRGFAQPFAFSLGRFEKGEHKAVQRTDVLVASIPTVAFRQNDATPNLEQLQSVHGVFDLVIVDECHHALAPTWRKTMQRLARQTKLLGLTATPIRGNPQETKQLMRMFDNNVIHEVPVLALIQAGILATPSIVTVATKAAYQATSDDRARFAQFHDLSPRLIKEIASDRKRTRFVVQTYVDRAATWGQTLVFAATRAHADELTAELQKRGVRANVIDGQTSADDRAALLEQFKTGQLNVLCNVLVFSEGTDVPCVDSVFIARPTQSEVLFRQMVGRGMRGPAFGGTARCNVVVFYDTVHNLVERQYGEVRSVETSSCSSAESALEMLGLPELEAAPVEVAPAVAGVSPRAAPAVTARIDARQLLAIGEHDLVLSAAHELQGWWELPVPGASLTLPVHSVDAEALRGYMERLQAQLQRNAPAPAEPALQFVAAARVKSFAAQAVAHGAVPFWNNVVGAHVAQVQLAVEREASPTAAVREAVVPWSRVIHAAAQAAASGAKLVRVGKEVVAVPDDVAAVLDHVWQDCQAFVCCYRDEATLAALASATAAQFQRVASTVGVVEPEALNLVEAFATAGRLRMPSLVCQAHEVAPSIAQLAAYAGRAKLTAADLAMAHQTFFAASHPTPWHVAVALVRAQAEAPLVGEMAEVGAAVASAAPDVEAPNAASHAGNAPATAWFQDAEALQRNNRNDATPMLARGSLSFIPTPQATDLARVWQENRDFIVHDPAAMSRIAVSKLTSDIDRTLAAQILETAAAQRCATLEEAVAQLRPTVAQLRAAITAQTTAEEMAAAYQQYFAGSHPEAWELVAEMVGVPTK